MLFYLNILKTEKILQFWHKKFSTCVIPAQELIDLEEVFVSYRRDLILSITYLK